MNTFLSGIITGLLLIAGNLFFITSPDLALGATFNPVGAGTYRLGQSIGTSDTSFKLSSFKEPVSNIPYTMGYINSDKVYATIAPQTSVSEFVSFTGITQNSDGSALITGVTRGLARTPGTGGCVASSTLAQSHAGQSIFILSNSPCFYSEFINTGSNSTSTATLVFSSTTPPHYDFNPTFNNFPSTTLASVQYVNSVAIAGAPDATEVVKGIVELATGAQMGSSTPFDNTTARLVPYSIYATSSPATAGNWMVVTMANAKIKQLFFDLTELFTFTGGINSTATTTIAASGTTTNAVVFNTIPYKFPNTRGASSTVITEDGGGSLSWNYPQWRLLASTTVTSAVASTTASWNATNIPTSTQLMVRIDVPQQTGNPNVVSMQFNGDVSATYSYITVNNAGTQVSASGVNTIRVGTSATNNGWGFTINILNPVSRTKTVTWQWVDFGTGTTLNQTGQAGATYNNTTSAISSITIGESTTLPIGTHIEVFGTAL